MAKKGRQPGPFEGGASSWVRFDAYEIRDRCIRPAPRATLHAYNPWQSYDELKRFKGSMPYQSQLDLAAMIEPDESEGKMRPAREKAVLDWCGEHGLLGVLPLRTLSVVLAPRMEYTPYFSAPDGSPQLHAVQRQMFRGRAGWVLSTSKWTEFTGELQRDELVPEPYRSDHFQAPGAFVQSLETGRWEWEPLARTWSRFFPPAWKQDPEVYLYPTPNSWRFWRVYAEPIVDFLKCATFFGEAIKKLYDREATDFRAFNRLLETTGPMITQPISGASAASSRWATGSLLGTFAAMAFLHITSGGRVFNCRVCGKMFVATGKQILYCSDTHRQRRDQQLYRARQRAPRGKDT